MKLITSTIASLLLLASVALLPATDAAKTGNNTIKHIDATAAAKLLKDNPKVAVLDVRTAAEFKAGHLKGATNYDFQSGSFKSSIKQLNGDQTYLVYCDSGERSVKALGIFQRLNQPIYLLDGGLKAWEKAGLPVVK